MSAERSVTIQPSRNQRYLQPMPIPFYFNTAHNVTFFVPTKEMIEYLPPEFRTNGKLYRR